MDLLAELVVRIQMQFGLFFNSIFLYILFEMIYFFSDSYNLGLYLSYLTFIISISFN